MLKQSLSHPYACFVGDGHAYTFLPKQVCQPLELLQYAQAFWIKHSEIKQK